MEIVKFTVPTRRADGFWEKPPGYYRPVCPVCRGVFYNQPPKLFPSSGGICGWCKRDGTEDGVLA